MTKEKQTRRMIAMALAASVATSAMPVTAFAETTVTDNGDGTTTTTTTTVSGDNTPSSPQVTEVKSETKTEGGYVTETKTSTTTESTTRQDASDNTEPGITNVKVEVVTNTYTGGSSVKQEIDEYSNEKTTDTKQQVNASAKEDQMAGQIAPVGQAPTGNPVPGSSQPNPGDPTGNGQNMDLDGDGVISDTEKFVSDFMEGTTITNESQTERENHEEHYDAKDHHDRPTENSGSVSGSETFTDTEITVTKTEVDNPDDTRNSDGTPELKGTTGPTLKEEGTYVKVPVVDADGKPVLDGNGNPVYETVLANPEVPTLTVPDVGDITVGLDRAKEDANGVTTNTVTVSVYENVVGQLKAGLDEDIVDDFKADFGDEVVITTDGDKADITKPVTYTATRTDADGNTIKTTVTLTPQTVVIGEKTYVTGYTTEKAEEITPKDSKVVSDNTIITDQDFAYKFDDLTVDGGTEGKPVVTTKTVVELPKDMPEEGAVSSRVNEQGHTETTTVVYIREKIDGEEKVTGYKNVVVVTDEYGNEFGGGEDVHNFKKSVVTTTSTKEVVKTTTIDTDTQQTIETTKEITKNVTTSTATVDVQKLEREVIASMFGFDTTFGNTNITSLQATAAPRYGNTAGTDGLHAFNPEYFTKQDGEYIHNGDTLPSNMIQYIQHALRSDYRINLKNDTTTAYMYELQDGNDNTFYGYCVDLATTAYRGFFYEIENLEDQDYYQQGNSNAVMNKDATDRLRAIALNGYWATKSGTGSLDAVKQLLRDKGHEDIADGLTPGEALAATQAALWNYGNSDPSDYVKGENITTYKNSDDENWSKVSIEGSDADKRIQTLYEVLLDLKGITKDEQNAGTNILDDTDILSSAITVGDFKGESYVDDDDVADKVYDTDLTFKLAVVPNGDGSGFTVLVKQGNSATQTFDMSELDKETVNGETTFRIEGVQLAAGIDANISFTGTQNLSQGVYLYTSELEEVDGDGVDGEVPSQTFISVASGSRQVTVDLAMNFTVAEPEAVTRSSSKRHTEKKTDKYETINTFHDQDVEVKTLVEVTQTVTTTLSNEWSGEYEQTWSYNDGSRDPIPTTPDPTTPDPTTPDPGMTIEDEEVPLAAPEDEGMVLGAEDEEDPMVLGEEEELIAATGDSNHMTAGFGGMLAALAGMFMLRKKKEN